MEDTNLILNLTRGTVLCERVVIADGVLSRMRGLLGRRSLASGEGLLLQGVPSIHTWFMRFAFDVVFLDGSLRVVRVREQLKPWRVGGARRALSVLELAAGEIVRRGVEVGDQIVVADYDLAIGRVDAAGAPSADGQRPGVGASGPEDGAAGPAPGAIPPDPDPPPHVLLVGTDRRFRSVVAALLARRGCTVSVAEDVQRSAQLAMQDHVDVVVLDASAMPALAALQSARLGALRPSIGMVLVSEHPVQAAQAPVVLPKWGSFDVLYDAIVLACVGNSD